MNETILNGESKDIVAENIQQLKQLFPEVFAEDSIDFDKLKAVLGEYTDDDNDRYNFTWWGKNKALRLAQTPSIGTLRPCPEESKDWDTTENLYIEGDNLEVLKLLQKTYHKKVKLIYIDPPYNTGKDFVYQDNYSDNIQNYLKITKQVTGNGQKISTNSETSGRYHTNWLNMLYPRLRLARNLLRDDGVILISIDDNELENLLKICDEIFGDENHLGTFIIKSTPNARDYGHIGKMHEFVVFFAKSREKTETNLLPDETKKFKYQDDSGSFNIHPLYNSNVAFTDKNRPNLYYQFYVNPQQNQENEFFKIGLEFKENWIEVYPPRSVKDNVQFVWRWGKTKALENLNKEIIGHKVGDEFRIVQKMRHSEKIIRSILDDKGVTSRRGTAEIEEIFGKKIFSFPKPLGLISTFVEMATKESSLVLDLFSGSATTAHAVLKLNAFDNGNRKFIMVQLPELPEKNSEAYKAGYQNISDIGKDRIRLAGDKVKVELGERYKAKQGQMLLPDDEKVMNPNDLDIGFKVFKLDSSNLKKWQPDADDLDTSLFASIENFVEGRNELDLVYEIMLKYGIDLTLPIVEYHAGDKKIYSVGMGALMICLDDKIATDVAKEIVRLKGELDPEIMRVVFKDNGFEDDSAKTNTREILRTNGIDEIVSI
jgi:adenine-specific DNA-methyltransferase